MLVLSRFVGEGFTISGNGLKEDIHIKITGMRKRDQAKIGIACSNEILIMRDELGEEDKKRLRDMHENRLQGEKYAKKVA